MQHEELAEVGAGVETPPEGVGAELGVEAEVGAGVEPEAVVLDVTEHPSAQMPDVVLNRPRTLPYPALATFATSPAQLFSELYAKSMLCEKSVAEVVGAGVEEEADVGAVVEEASQPEGQGPLVVSAGHAFPVSSVPVPQAVAPEVGLGVVELELDSEMPDWVK